MEYVALALHSPEACPSSNAKVRERAQQAMGRMEEIGKKHQVKLKSAHVLGPKHLIVFIFEAAGIEAVRDFIRESGIIQWNDTELYPSQTMQEAMQAASSLAPIW
jgi:hypothetical protein